MEITTRSLWTLIHGMGFGALYLLAASGALLAIWQRWQPALSLNISHASDRFLKTYLVLMALLAWFSVLTGTYLIYPWYRSPAPGGRVDLAAYPRSLLLASPSTSAWHTIGMEWKEHVAWLVPIAISTVAVIVLRYGADLVHYPELRTGLLTLVVASLVTAAIAGFFGAMLNKEAPVAGGVTLRLVRGGSK